MWCSSLFNTILTYTYMRNLEKIPLSQLEIISRYSQLVELCEYPNMRLSIYIKILTEFNSPFQQNSIFNTISIIMYQHAPLIWQSVRKQDKINIYNKFVEITSRRPKMHKIICALDIDHNKYQYWEFTKTGKQQRIFVLNSAISDCIREILKQHNINL